MMICWISRDAVNVGKGLQETEARQLSTVSIEGRVKTQSCHQSKVRADIQFPIDQEKAVIRISDLISSLAVS